MDSFFQGVIISLLQSDSLRNSQKALRLSCTDWSQTCHKPPSSQALTSATESNSSALASLSLLLILFSQGHNPHCFSMSKCQDAQLLKCVFYAFTALSYPYELLSTPKSLILAIIPKGP